MKYFFFCSQFLFSSADKPVHLIIKSFFWIHYFQTKLKHPKIVRRQCCVPPSIDSLIYKIFLLWLGLDLCQLTHLKYFFPSPLFPKNSVPAIWKSCSNNKITKETTFSFLSPYFLLHVIEEIWKFHWSLFFMAVGICNLRQYWPNID